MRKLTVCGEQVHGDAVALERLERAMTERFNDLVKLSDQVDQHQEQIAEIKEAFAEFEFSTGDMPGLANLHKAIFKESK